MNEYALLHRTDAAYCFPVSETSIVLRLRAARGDLRSVTVLYESKYRIAERRNEAPMKRILRGKLFDYFSVTLTLTDTRLAYVFLLDDGTERRFFSEDGVTETYDFPKGYYNFFQYPYINRADIMERVGWLADASFYQIFVDRFFIGKPEKEMSYVNLDWGETPTSKSFAGGDLAGITKKLDYIKGLGFTALYLTPIFRSPSNHKYDISDYRTVDPSFGTGEDLHDLVDSLHARGMRLVLDAVFNHCSEETAEFQDVLRHGRKSPYHDWFVIDGDVPEKTRRNYEVFADCAYMPKWNTSNPAVQDYLIDVALYYLREYQIDGWRLDVSDEISHAFWRRFRSAVKREKPDAVIIGENWHDASHYLNGDQYDSIMNYAFTKACLDYFAYGALNAAGMAERLSDLLSRNTDTVNDMMLNLLDSHDTDRFFSEVSGNRKKLHAALCLLYLFPGEPSVFYGTEVYTEGGYDPDCRRCMDWELAETGTKVSALLARLSELRKQERFSFAGTELFASEDGRLLCLKRIGEKSEVTLYINESGETGTHENIRVAAGDYQIFRNGGEWR